MKIVILDGYTENPDDLNQDGFTVLGELTVYGRTPVDQILSCIGDVEIVITNKTPLTRETSAAYPSVRYIGVLATDYNVVDIKAAKEKGIPVTNIPTYGTTTVAQMVFALLLEICHHVGEHSEAVHREKWTKSPDFCFWNAPLIELAGKTVGVIGFGRIGQNTAQIARAFGLQVLTCDGYPNDAARVLGDYVTLGELLTQLDIIFLHCPLLPSTEEVINKDSIAKVKDGVILINTSRGPLVAETDLAQALNSGKMYTARLDVVATEPIRTNSPLLNAKNYIVTPHITWTPEESRAHLMDIAVNNLKTFLEQKPVNMVNA